MIATILALAVASAPACSWDHPGANRYQLNPHVAVADYHLDAEVAGRLEYRMQTHQYDEVVTITRDSIGDGKYTDLREMHFGQGKVCHGPVERAAWQQDRVEVGLVYCEGDVCLLVPTICNNVSLVTKRPEEDTADTPIDIVPAAGPTLILDVPNVEMTVSTETGDATAYTPLYGSSGGGTFGGGDFGSGGGGVSGGGGGELPPPCGCTPPPCPPPITPPIPSIPEPMPALLWVVGLMSLWRKLK